MKSAQVGATELLNNIIGYHVHIDPGPILVLQPTLEMGQIWSKDRLAPMLRDTPCLQHIVADARARDAGNTIFHKTFTGGHLSVAGANSPASLASRPIRILLADEVDRYPVSAGAEGDPLALAIKRTNNFWNRKIGLFSTPTVKGASRIEQAYLESDQRSYWIPCPHCQVYQRLLWGNVVWTKDKLDEAAILCTACGCTFNTAQKNMAVKRGEWRAAAPYRGIAGFHINELYSPWRTLGQIVADYLVARDHPERLQVWVNTTLGETWEIAGETLREELLIGRVENYPAPVPSRGVYLTAGIDTQMDRLEVEVVAWGVGEESWNVAYQVLRGDPDIPEGHRGSPWTLLSDFLRSTWKHESGKMLSIESACIDSGGANTQAVYSYCKTQRGRRVFAIKGRGGTNIPIVGPLQRRRSGRMGRPVDLFIVGVDQAKCVITKRLALTEPGPGYCHFPAERTADYFRQLTSERQVTTRVAGVPRREWVKFDGRRNEALDCRVYAYAALLLCSPNLDRTAHRVLSPRNAPVEPPPDPMDILVPKKPESSFMDRLIRDEVLRRQRRHRHQESWVTRF